MRGVSPHLTPRATGLISSLLIASALTLAGFLTGCVGLSTEFKPTAATTPRISDPKFRQVTSELLGSPVTSGNRVTTLIDGDQIFPAMLRAIRSARRTITFETYIFEKGEIPQRFAAALAERARAGVKVHVILDAIGGAKSRPYHAMMREAGVDLHIYRPAWRSLLPQRYNNRTHRKLLVIDGRVGFIGGVGIGDQWRGRGHSPEHWHDLHYRVEGPAVAQLQSTFMENWIEGDGLRLSGSGYFPKLSPAGRLSGSVFASSPERYNRKAQLMFHLAISGARRSILIENAYFLPDKTTVEALADAARRGVHVQLIVPGQHMNQKAVQRGARRLFVGLAAAGVEVYEYEPTMAHAKLLIADGLFVSVGSSNLDSRSLRINDEANLNVFDAGFAAEQTRIFRRDLARSKRWQRDVQGPGAAAEAPLQLLQIPLEPQL